MARRIGLSVEQPSLGMERTGDDRKSGLNTLGCLRPRSAASMDCDDVAAAGEASDVRATPRGV
jgi:hypothetical protein